MVRSLPLFLVLPAVDGGRNRKVDEGSSPAEWKPLGVRFKIASLCECDLDPFGCDVNCCCDEACGCEEIAAFSVECLCRPEFVSVHSCGSNWVSTAERSMFYDLKPLLCVESGLGYTPVFGYRRDNASAVKTIDEAKEGRSSFASQSETDQQEWGASLGHTTGTLIPTYRIISSNANAALSFLSIPTAVNGGACTEFSPVTFNVPRSEICLRLPRDFINECKPGGGLDSGRYSSLIGFQSSARRGQGDVLPNDRIKVIAVNHDFGTLLQGLPTVAADTPMSGDCSNAVRSVRYIMYWNGQLLEAVTVVLSISNISGSVPLAQEFSVEFSSSSQPALNEVPPTPMLRSGNPGYLVGRPLLERAHGSNRTDITTMLAPSPDGSCDGSVAQPLIFGQDVTTGCITKLLPDRFEDCSALRDSMQALLLQGTNDILGIENRSISGYGNTEHEDGVNIITSERLMTPNDPLSYLSEVSCPDIPTELEFDVIVARVGKITNPQNRVLGVRATFLRGWLGFSCAATSQPCLEEVAVELRQSIRFFEASEDVYSGNTFYAPPRHPRCRGTWCYEQILYPITRSWGGLFDNAITSSLYNADAENQRNVARAMLLGSAFAVAILLRLSILTATF